MSNRIVIAWTEMDGMEKTGRQIHRPGDPYNWFPEFKAIERARAAIWLNDGTLQDVIKAREHLDTISDKVRSEVYVIPAKERDPLGMAKRRVMGLDAGAAAK